MIFIRGKFKCQLFKLLSNPLYYFQKRLFKKKSLALAEALRIYVEFINVKQFDYSNLKSNFTACVLPISGSLVSIIIFERRSLT